MIVGDSTAYWVMLFDILLKIDGDSFAGLLFFLNSLMMCAILLLDGLCLLIFC